MKLGTNRAEILLAWFALGGAVIGGVTAAYRQAGYRREAARLPGIHAPSGTHPAHPCPAMTLDTKQRPAK